ncbi:MAG: aspartyl protease family protein [Flavobacteriales bacterium]|nr:aspartyl protease family protein [Flavobacteriales bacterium]
MKRLTLLLVAFIVFALAGGCGASKTVRLCDATKAPTEAFRDSIPFVWKYSSIVVQIEVPGTGRKWDMIFDTGASYSVLNQTNTQLDRIEKVATVSVGDTHGNRQSTPIMMLDSVLIGNTLFTNHAAVSVPYDENSILRCIAADGILGANLMKKCHWMIDYDRKMIFFSSSRDGLPPPESDEGIQEFQLSGGRPHIDIDLNGFEVSHVLMDTGYNGFMEASPSVVKALRDSTTGEWTYFRKFDGTTFGLYGVKNDTLYFSPNHTLTLADGSSWNYLMEVQGGSGAKLGNDLFRHYNMYFYFPDKELQWVKRDTISVNPLEPGFGVGMMWTARGIEVRSLTEGGPAQLAGIELGDMVERLGKIPAGEFKGRICDLYDYLRETSDQHEILTLDIRGKGVIELQKGLYPLRTSESN